ncbi:galactokinase [Aquimarina sp. U1-2]|uniref:galactokinase n=1 Tax=Aquimarina sp. U1-2 TaxID=2823141 RepID=UPI001AECE027|nr:galactokinase [Aquimarina sp. U1-2]MBP2830876.1 galactokinase [Aquimarina sp. U1-2]
MAKKLKKKVLNSFENRFDTAPLIVFSPGRINLIGEHTDYNEGFTFPAAINKGIVVALSKSNTEKSQIYAVDKKEAYEFTVQDIAPLENGGWRNYILGVVSELQKLGKKIGNFNAVFAGNIPSGAGMSSSAALENGFVLGLNELFGLQLSKKEMIFIAQKAEHNFVGVKCGIMDQFASMFGIKNSALFLDCRTVQADPYHIDLYEYKLMLINSNVKHDLSESAYNDRRAVCEKVSDILNVNALRDASKKDLDCIRQQISEEEYQKALYVINENLRVQQFSESIKKGDLVDLGDLLYQSHKGLSEHYKVSCSELDFLVNNTKENPNILGARMMGGGFGGCTINLILKSEYKAFKKEITKKFKERFKKECSIYSVKLADGTQLI